MKKAASKEEKPKKHTVVCQKWEESERGWGTRPDGHSLHLTEEDRKEFVKAFWKRQRELLGEETPDEYTRESGQPYAVTVDEKLYRQLKADARKGGHGIWQTGTHPNGHPGFGGWSQR